MIDYELLLLALDQHVTNNRAQRYLANLFFKNGDYQTGTYHLAAAGDYAIAYFKGRQLISALRDRPLKEFLR